MLGCCCFLVVFIPCIILVVRVELPGRYYHKFPSFTMSPVATLTSIDSLSSCVFKCLGVTDLCYSFIYVASLQTCRLGTHLLTVGTNMTVDGAEYFAMDCARYQGFTYKTLGGASTCLWLSPNTSDYTTAKLSCAARGAHLYTYKTPDKFSILVHIANTVNSSIRVGLDDIKTEGTYVWADDGSVMTSDMNYTWAKGQPNNYLNQDCIFFDNPKNGSNDEYCTVLFLYLCETN